AAVAAARSPRRPRANRGRFSQWRGRVRGPRSPRSHARQRGLRARARRHLPHAAALGQVSRTSGYARGRSRGGSETRARAGADLVRNADVPESLEGWWILHRMFGFDRRRWALLPGDEQQRIVQEASGVFAELKRGEGDLGLAQLL